MATQTKVNKTIRGASRSMKSREEKTGKFAALAVILRVLAVTAGVVAVIYFAGLWIKEQLDRPVSSVKINGEFNRVVRQEVAEHIYQSISGGFVEVDLRRIQTRLEDLPWIDSAKVARSWPGGLEVTVIEHKPIARWGEGDALNHRGEVIVLSGSADDEVLLQGLPQLIGMNGMEHNVMAQYHALTKVLGERGLAIARLEKDLSRSWSLVLADGVEINIGRDQVMDRIGRFLIVFEAQLQQRWAELSYIDLRYFNGVAVKWRETEKPVDTASKG
ncbi:MAG: hypothetical protein CL693_21510 [Cellvibrionaceae bacterium]|nr:hypothetical protein [Cellvibrionaceae bacterium]|tara:strand:+ start:35243 stop:36064 length:822 start_codon:yes stop_codon:yes gene_type:complete